MARSSLEYVKTQFVNCAQLMKKNPEKLFYEYVHKAEGMDPLRAMQLLTRACMNYMHVSAGYRSMAYYAGGHWLKAFNKTDHPLTAQTKDMAFCEVMPLICFDYSQEEYDEFDVIHIDPDDEERLLSEMMNELDEETVIALCMGYWLANM